MRRRRGRATANETSSVRRFVMDRGESRVRVMVRVGGATCCALREKEEKTPRCLKTARGGAAPSRLTPPSFVASSHCPPRRRRAARGRLREVGAREETRSGQSGERRPPRALESRTRGGGGGVSRASRCARVRSMVPGLGSGTAAPAPVLKTVQGEGDSGFWKLMIRLRRGRCCLRCARPEGASRKRRLFAATTMKNRVPRHREDQLPSRVGPRASVTVARHATMADERVVTIDEVRAKPSRTSTRASRAACPLPRSLPTVAPSSVN